MDLDELLGFLPILIFILTIVIDKSQRRKRRNNRGHFPPLPDVDDVQRQDGSAEYGTAETAQETAGADAVYREQPAAKKEEKPWYVEFPEDRRKKEPGRVFETPEPQKDYKVYHEPAFIAPDVVKIKTPAPVFAVPRLQPKRPAFSRRINRKRLRDGVIMAEILDKPRALKPYREPY